MLIFEANGKPIPLGQKLGGGGENDVYHVSDQRQLAAKIYRNPSRYREAKLRAMISNPPTDPAVSVCWPKSLLVNQAGACAGFLMNRADIAACVPVSRLYNAIDRQNASLDITWKYLVRAAKNIAASVEAIHAQGHVIGDFNESNILAGNDALITLVGCDSIQVCDASRSTFFRCTAGKPEFTPPELQGSPLGKIDHSIAHDNFGLGVLVFLLLMEGVHPYSGVWKQKSDPPSLEDRIRNGISPYAGYPEIDCMPAAPAFDLLPAPIAELFVKCFKDGHADPSRRPSADDWKKALAQLEENLTECRVNRKHVYSSHLESCPWCERKEALGGFDAFPSEIQKPPGVEAAPPGQVHTGKELRVIPHSSVKRYAHLRRAAAVLVLAALVLLGWNLVREPARRLWSAVRSSSIYEAKSELTLSPMLMCTGVDANGVPTGVSDTYTQEQVQETGVTAFLTYSGAMPGKTSFQMRWTIEDRTYESRPQTFEKEMDSIQVNLGKELPPGNHQIEFWVDGKVQRQASMTIEGAQEELIQSAEIPSGQRKRTRRAAKIAETHSHVIPYTNTAATAAVEKPASIDAKPSETLPQKQEEYSWRPAASHPDMIRYAVEHRHTIGRCSGELRLTPESIEFISEEHTFKFDVGDVRLVRDGIQDPDGKSWRFTHAWNDLGHVLRMWKNGQLHTQPQ